MITLNNYEEYLIDHLHGELPESDMKEIEKFMNENPAVRNEFELLKQTVFTPERDIIFTGKNILLRPVELSFFTKYKKYLAAAAVIGGVVLSTLFLFQKHNRPEIIESQVKILKTDEQKLIPTAETAIPSVMSRDNADVAAQKSGKAIKKRNSDEPTATTYEELPPENTVIQKKSEDFVNQFDYNNKANENRNEEMPVVKNVTEEDVKPVTPLQILTPETEIPTLVNSPSGKNTLEFNKQRQPKLFRAISQIVKLSRKIKNKKDALANTDIIVIVGNKKIVSLN